MSIFRNININVKALSPEMPCPCATRLDCYQELLARIVNSLKSSAVLYRSWLVCIGTTAGKSRCLIWQSAFKGNRISLNIQLVLGKSATAGPPKSLFLFRCPDGLTTKRTRVAKDAEAHKMMLASGAPNGAKAAAASTRRTVTGVAKDSAADAGPSQSGPRHPRLMLVMLAGASACRAGVAKDTPADAKNARLGCFPSQIVPRLSRLMLMMLTFRTGAKDTAADANDALSRLECLPHPNCAKTTAADAHDARLTFCGSRQGCSS